MFCSLSKTTFTILATFTLALLWVLTGQNFVLWLRVKGKSKLHATFLYLISEALTTKMRNLVPNQLDPRKAMITQIYTNQGIHFLDDQLQLPRPYQLDFPLYQRTRPLLHYLHFHPLQQKMRICQPLLHPL